MPNARPWRRRQRPAAAQRCAEGAGLDGVDRGSTISCAVHRTSDMLTTSLTRADASMSTFTTPRIYTCLTDATLRLGVTVIACRANLGATDPRIVSVMAPFDPGNLPQLDLLAWRIIQLANGERKVCGHDRSCELFK
jgi:hypothetical protein